MFIIVAHHYVANSGVIQLICEEANLTGKSIFMLLFGWGGDTGINCFIMITGYFMCKQSITPKKFLKLCLEVMFYNITIYAVFLIFGGAELSIKEIMRAVLPISAVTNSFVPAYLIFYLLIPFLNILIGAMNEKQHIRLVALGLFTYTVLSTMVLEVVFNYVTWFSVVYMVASYIRLYPKKIFDNGKLWGILAAASLLASWGSVIFMAFVSKTFKIDSLYYYFFVSDTNKPLALITAVCAFMFFKNLDLKYNKVINKIAASCFGVLLIHNNGAVMRQWLWKDFLKNPVVYETGTAVIHALVSVVSVYALCTAADMLRIKFLERPVLNFLSKKEKNYEDSGDRGSRVYRE